MKSHIHKYRRLTTTKGKPYWRCVDPGCSHILYQDDLIVGRVGRCWLCDEEMTIKTTTQARPVCDVCKEARKERMEKFKQIS